MEPSRLFPFRSSHSISLSESHLRVSIRPYGSMSPGEHLLPFSKLKKVVFVACDRSDWDQADMDRLGRYA